MRLIKKMSIQTSNRMKFHHALRLVVLVLISISTIASAATLDSASGSTFEFIIHGADAPYRTTGRHRFLALDSGTTYRIFNVENVIDSSGTMTFVRVDSRIGRIEYNDSIDGSGFSQTMDFVGPNYGTFSLNNSNFTGSQWGDFVVYSGNASGSFTRKVLQLDVTGGSSLFPGGTYRFVSIGTANYVIESTPGVANSSGTFTYAKLNRSSSQLTFSDVTFGTGSNVLTFASASSGVFLLRTDAGGQQTGTFTLSDFLLPVFKAQPLSRTVPVGDPVTFQATVAGTQPLSFQWQKNGVGIPGATSSSFTIPSVQVSDAGNYRLVAQNIGGSIVSSNATLTPECNYVLSPQSEAFDYLGGEGSILVGALGDCGWTVLSDVSWIRITSANNGTGVALVTYSVATNTTGFARIAHVKIGNKKFSVAQTPQPAPRSLVGKIVVLSGEPSSRLLFVQSNIFLANNSSAIDLGNYSYSRNDDTTANVVYFEDGQSRDLSLSFETLKSGTFTLRSGEEILSEGTFVVTDSGPDFNFDTRPDLFFQNTNGSLAAWFMDGNSFMSSGFIRGGRAPGTGWHARGAADFTGDGNTDVLLQHDSGQLAVWCLKRTNFLNAVLLRNGTPMPAGWRIAGVADFNQDNQADILFEHTSRIAMVWHFSKTTFLGSQLLAGGTPAGVGWKIVGTGDFNGDNLTDVLWQHNDGRLAVWYLVNTERVSAGFLSPSFSGVRVRGANDFNSDGWSDVIFRNAGNQLIVWSLQGIQRTETILLRNGQSVSPSWALIAP